jgi:hypothetical protein
MDGQRFDQLARAFAKGASRRRVLKGLVAGAAGGALAQMQTHNARAQCTWSGTFEAPFGGSITMTLNETGGQVDGSYIFTDDATVVNGTITGIVRTEYPGYTVLDGYWREPGEGGRIWFSMSLDSCSQFTGSYTDTDVSEAWTAGWDGTRTSAGGGENGGGEAQITLYSNPGDSRVAAFSVDGQSTVLFGPKDADGIAEYINHAQIDSPDGDPQKQAFLDFDAAGTLTRAALASGETLLFEMVSPTRVIITYQSADGSQEVQFPFEAGVATNGQAGLMAYAGLSDLARVLDERRAGLYAAQLPSMGNRGLIEVRCGGG